MSSERSNDIVQAERLREKIFKLCFHSTAKAKDGVVKLFVNVKEQSFDIDTTKSVIFPSSGINDFSDAFHRLNSLRFIDLSNNNIRELPKTIFHGKTCLEVVTFDNNRIKELDEDLFQGLTELRVVSFNNNLIAKLADNFLGDNHQIR
jgi:5-methylcytosine-specific restriction endonuclease McrBC regulatory subunit McrC